MSYNGTGTFSVNTAGQPVVTGTTITSTAFNTLTADLATGLSTALCKDGQSTPTANIGMGAFKITNLGAGTLATDAARLSQIQSGAATFVVASGTDTILGTGSPALTAYATGNAFQFTVASTNTGAATLNIDSLGAKAITRDGSTALVAGDLVSGSVVTVVYDGTRFQVLNSNSKTNFNLSGTLTAASTATATKFVPTGTSATGNGMYLPAANALAFSTNGTEAMRINSAGIVGIAGTPGAWSSGYEAIQICGTTANYVTSNAGVFGLTNNVYIDSVGAKYITSASAATRNYQLNGEHVWENAPSGTAGNAVTLTERMRIASTGFVGIGTTTPTGQLSFTNQISSGSLLTYAATGGVNGQNILNGYYAGGTYVRYLDIAAVGSPDGSNGGSAIRFLTNPLTLNSPAVERMQITSTGNVGIGTASPAAKLDVNGLANFSGTTDRAVYVAYSGSTNIGIQFDYGSASGTANQCYFNYNGTNVGSIQSSSTATSYLTSSDYRRKNVVGAVSGSGTRIDALNPIDYEWKVDNSQARGFLAHEFQEVYPNSVSGTKDGTKEEEYEVTPAVEATQDADGVELTPAEPAVMGTRTVPDYQSMQASTSEVIADLVAELQSLRKRIATLEAK